MLLQHVAHQSIQPRWKCRVTLLFVSFDYVVLSCQYQFIGVQFYEHSCNLSVAVMVSCSQIKPVMQKMLLRQSRQTSLIAKLCPVGVMLPYKCLKTKYVCCIKKFIIYFDYRKYGMCEDSCFKLFCYFTGFVAYLVITL